MKGRYKLLLSVLLMYIIMNIHDIFHFWTSTYERIIVFSVFIAFIQVLPFSLCVVYNCDEKILKFSMFYWIYFAWSKYIGPFLDKYLD